MKLLTLTRSFSDYAQGRFREEAKKKKIQVDVFNYSRLVFEINKQSFTIKSDTNKDLSKYDAVILRSPGLTRRYVWQERVLVDWLYQNNKKVLNWETLTHFPGEFDKLLQNYIFYLEKIPFVPTTNYGYAGFLKKIKYPFIVKRVMGSLGRDFAVIKSKKDLDGFLLVHHPYEFIAQPFLPSGEDFRMIVIGGRVLGAMKRIAPEKYKPTNAAAGGMVEKAKLTPELRSLTLRAARALRAEFCGVDVMYDTRGNPHVLEVNRYSVFKEFEHVTGINVAGEMIDYLLGK